MNGNRWVGTGHNSVFRDRDGQWWTAYHAVDKNDPYFKGEPGFTKRPALLDPVTWVDGWPSVRAGRWASDERMPAPAAQPEERSRYRAKAVRPHRLGRLLFSDGFAGNSLDSAWSWQRPPTDPTSYGVENGRFRFDVQAADLYVDDVPEPSVLLRRAPRRDFVVQTKLSLDVPAEGCCFNFAQGGLVLYGSDDSFVKLTHTSIYETRQTEWAKEVPTGLTRYGNTVVGPPGEDDLAADRQGDPWPGIVLHRLHQPGRAALGPGRDLGAQPAGQGPADRPGVDGSGQPDGRHVAVRPRPGLGVEPLIPGAAPIGAGPAPPGAPGGCVAPGGTGGSWVTDVGTMRRCGEPSRGRRFRTRSRF